MSTTWSDIRAGRFASDARAILDSAGLYQNMSNRYKLPLAQVKKIFDQLLRAHDITWDKNRKTIPMITLQRIDKLFQERVHHGKGAIARARSAPNSAAEAGVDVLIGRRKSREKVPPAAVHCRPRQATLSDYFSSLMVKAKESDLTEFRHELLRAASEAYTNKTDDLVYQCFAYPLLSLIAFTSPRVGSEIEFEGKRWRVEKRFDLATIGGAIQAFALSTEEKPPMLIFKGSTFPGDEGFAATWISDTTPGLSVGHIAARSADLKEWIVHQRDVTVVGASLGGALALHMVSLYGDHVGNVHAYNPAGLEAYVSYGEQRGMDVHIYSQWNDLVSTMGYFPPWATVYRIVPLRDQNFIVAHARIFAGEDEVTIFKTTGKYENSRPERHALVATRQICSPITFTLLGTPTLLYRTYELFSLSYLSEKEGTTKGDLLLVITWVAIGALLIAFATFLLTHRKLPQIQRIIDKIGNKKFTAIASVIGTVGGLMALCGVRALTRLHSKKITIESLNREHNGLLPTRLSAHDANRDTDDIDEA